MTLSKHLHKFSSLPTNACDWRTNGSDRAVALEVYIKFHYESNVTHLVK